MLDDILKQRFQQAYERLLSTGKLFSQQQLQQYYSTFQNRFGPEQLLKLNGEELLETMHHHGNRESLVYWLEFKDDDEFPSRWFGSIAGGSALKFGIFKRKETGKWNTYGHDGKPKEIGIQEAIGIAERHRDELIGGVKEINAVPASGTDEDYLNLEHALDGVATSVSKLAWGHKYFHLMCPDKIDDFHSPEWQRFHLTKLLQDLPPGEGRYVCAGRFVRLANEMGWPVPILDAVLNELHGSRHRYWRIGTSDGGAPRNQWPQMRDGGYVSIGWDSLGDLSSICKSAQNYDSQIDATELLTERLAKNFPDMNASVVGRTRSQFWHFLNTMTVGDYVFAADGGTVIAVGRVTGEYHFDPTHPFHHQRPVKWLSFEEWQTPEREGLQTTVYEMKKPLNLLRAEKAVQGSPAAEQAQPAISDPVKAVPRLSGIPGRIQSVLDRKSQVILYGPPGTGKTFWAEKAACDLAAYSAFGLPFDQLNDQQKKAVVGTPATSYVRICCFHPSYGYEDFMEGFRPDSKNGQISFELRAGIFKQLCIDAANTPDQRFFLVIDEINRGDIPRIFGELLTVLERDKRGKSIILSVSHTSFKVPSNVFVIGTMNTADRSISLLDAALRRRFGFIELMPDSTVLRDHSISGLPLSQWFEALNQRICQHVGRNARHLQIGHSYLLSGGRPLKDLMSLRRAVLDDIIPLIEEYCYEDFQALQSILGTALVDLEARRIRQELFEDGRDDDLLLALLQPCPEITTSIDADAAPSELEDVEEDQSSGEGSK